MRGFNVPWSAPHPGHLTSWLVAALGEGLGFRLLRVFGFAEDVARSFCETRGGRAERFFPDLGVGLLGGAAGGEGGGEGGLGGGEFGMHLFSARVKDSRVSVSREGRIFSQVVAPRRWEAFTKFLRELEEVERLTIKVVLK